MKRKNLAGILILVLVGAFVFCGCGTQNTPSAKVAEELEQFRTDGSEKMVEAVNLGIDGLKADGIEDFVDMIMDFEYEIVDESIDGDVAEVKVKIKTYSFGDAFTEVMPTLFMAALSGGDEDAMVKTMMDAFTGLDEKDYEKTIVVNCEKNGDNWTSDIGEDNKEFVNAVSGGMLDAVDTISAMFGDGADEWTDLTGSAYAGTWRAVGISYDGIEMTPEEAGLDFVLEINGDGTLAAFTNGEDDGTGSWEETDSGIKITDSTSAEMSGYLEGEQLIVDFGDDFIVKMEKDK